jgi:hypothetical protein
MSNNALATLAPTNMKEAMEFAGLLAKSDIVPKDYQGKPGNVLVAIQWGMEIGLQPMQAMQNIAVINGRPSIWGDAMIALVRACPAFEYINETQDDKQAVCVIKRKGEPEAVRTFSLEDAKRAGLLGKSGPWTQYPKRMMQMRARSWALRDVFPDVLKGMICAEEALDSGPRDVTPVTRTAAALERIKQSKQEQAPEPQPDTTAMDACLDAIARCGDLDQLRAAAKTFPATLTDGQKATVAAAYAERKACLDRAHEETAATAQSQDDFDAELNETAP